MAQPGSRPGGNPIGVVAALRSEAHCLSPRHRAGGAAAFAPLLVQSGGMGCERAARTAQRLVQSGARSLLCWGVAGALDPSLRCGDVVLATEVICERPLALHLESMRPTALPAHARLRTSDPWRAQLAAALLRQGPAVQGPMLTSAELVCESAHKARLFRDTGALAVDMESAAVGVVASLHGLPFVVLRVVADSAADELPGVLRVVAGPQSAGPMAWVGWLSVACAPAAWPGLARLGRRYRTARRVLQQCARQVSGPPQPRSPP